MAAKACTRRSRGAGLGPSRIRTGGEPSRRRIGSLQGGGAARGRDGSPCPGDGGRKRAPGQEAAASARSALDHPGMRPARGPRGPRRPRTGAPAPAPTTGGLRRTPRLEAPTELGILSPAWGSSCAFVVRCYSSVDIDISPAEPAMHRAVSWRLAWIRWLKGYLLTGGGLWMTQSAAG